MIVGIFMIVQNRFNLFNVSWKSEDVLSEEKSEGDGEEKKDNEDKPYVEIEIPNGLSVRVNIEISDDDLERSLGLSGRKNLGDYEGMFFVFQNEVNNPFWMKGMLIPLDIIFIDSENYIVDIRENEQPCSENICPSIYSDQKFMYVLEVNSEFCKENGIEEGYHVVQYFND